MPFWCVLLALCVALSGPRVAAAQTEPTPAGGDSPDIFGILEEDRAITERIVSVTKSAQSQAETPAIVTVITRAQILEAGYRSLGEALAAVPGLYVVDNLVTANVGVRGIEGGPDSWSRVVKVLIDGDPATFYSTGGTLLGPEFLPMIAIEAIEVIRGPASALYGGNAFLGVINVRTRAAKKNELDLSGEAGVIRTNPSGAGQIFGTVSGQGEKPSSVTGAVTAEVLDRSGLAVPPQSPSAASYAGRSSKGDLSKPLGAFVHGAWNTGNFGSVELQVLHQRLNAQARFSELGALAPANHVAIANTRLQARYMLGLLADRLTIRLRAAYSHGETLPEQVLDVGDPTFTVRRERDNQAFDAAAEVSYALGRHFFLLGADLVSDRHIGDGVYRHITPSPSAPQSGNLLLLQLPKVLTFINTAPYAQAVFYPWAPLGITLGVRYDVNPRWGNAVSGRAAAVYNPLAGLYLKLLYGGSFVPPSPTQLTVLGLRAGDVQGSPGLKNQKAHTGEIALDYRVSELFGFAVNGFFTSIEDRIEFVDFGGAQLLARNLTSSQTFGAEMTADFRWRWLTAHADFSLQKTSVAPPPVLPGYWTMYYDPSVAGGNSPAVFPPWMGHLSAGVKPPNWHVQLTALLRVSGPRKSTLMNARLGGVSYTLPTYANLDMHLRSVDLKFLGERETAFSLHVTNVLGTAFSEPGLQGVDIPALGRTIFLKVTQEF